MSRIEKYVNQYYPKDKTVKLAVEVDSWRVARSLGIGNN